MTEIVDAAVVDIEKGRGKTHLVKKLLVSDKDTRVVRTWCFRTSRILATHREQAASQATCGKCKYKLGRLGKLA